jgi:hypothetical protein
MSHYIAWLNPPATAMPFTAEIICFQQFSHSAKGRMFCR